MLSILTVLLKSCQSIIITTSRRVQLKCDCIVFMCGQLMPFAAIFRVVMFPQFAFNMCAHNEMSEVAKSEWSYSPETYRIHLLPTMSIDINTDHILSSTFSSLSKFGSQHLEGWQNQAWDLDYVFFSQGVQLSQANKALKPSKEL